MSKKKIAKTASKKKKIERPTIYSKELVLNLINTKVQLKPVEEYGDILKGVVEKLGKINDARNEQQTEKAEEEQKKQNDSTG